MSTDIMSPATQPIGRHGWVLLAAAMLLGACSDQVDRAVYDGVRESKSIQTVGREAAPPAMPDFDRYERERNTLKGRCSAEPGSPGC